MDGPKEKIVEVIKYVEVQRQAKVNENKTTERGSEELEDVTRNIQVIKPINKIQEANQDLNEYQKITKSKRKKIEYKKNKPTVGKGLENREKEYNVNDFTSTDRRNRLKVMNYEHKFFKQADDFKPKTPRMPILTKIPLYTQGMVKEYTKYTPSPKRIKYTKYTPVLQNSISISSDSKHILDLSKLEGETESEEQKQDSKSKIYIDYTGKKLNFAIKNKRKS